MEAPDDPKRRQERPKEGPGAARSAPRAAQEVDKGLKKASLFRSCSLGGSGDRFWMTFGFILYLRGDIFQGFPAPFRSHLYTLFLEEVSNVSPSLSYRDAPSSKRPARPRSGRARAYAILRACCIDRRGALATLALLCFVVFALLLSLFLLLLLLSPCLQCLHALSPLALPVP